MRWIFPLDRGADVCSAFICIFRQFVMEFYSLPHWHLNLFQLGIIDPKLFFCSVHQRTSFNRTKTHHCMYVDIRTCFLVELHTASVIACISCFSVGQILPTNFRTQKYSNMGTVARLAPNQLQHIDDEIEHPFKKRKIDKEENNCVNPCAGIGIINLHVQLLSSILIYK